MKRRDILKAAMALPVAAMVPVMALPKTTYRYFTIVKMAPLQWRLLDKARDFYPNEIFNEITYKPQEGMNRPLIWANSI